MKKLITTLAFVTLLFVSVKPAEKQDSEEPTKPVAEFSGFFRFDYWYDSRQVVDAIDGLLHLYPAAQNLDANGKDINGTPTLNGLALATRVRSIITMPELFNAKSSIYVEVDFTGIHNMAHIRFRHGVANLRWESGTVLQVGQTWHPMFVTEAFPHVGGLNTGAPFQSFNRSPQVTLRQPIGGSARIILSALTQGDYKCFGPEGYSTIYLRRNIIPNLHAQIQLATGPLVAGVASDYKGLRPRAYTTSVIDNSEHYIANERMHALSWMAYAKVKSGLLTVSAKGMYGQNLADHLMFGGYAVSTLDSLTGKETYTPFNHIFAHLNVTYGRTIMPGIFVGWAKNLGTTESIVQDATRIWGRGVNYDNIIRVSPNLTYRNNKLTLIGEVEYTMADIGVNSLTDNAKVINTHNVANTRLQFVVQYDF